jgi:hypothetical protein
MRKWEDEKMGRWEPEHQQICNLLVKDCQRIANPLERKIGRMLGFVGDEG